MSWGDVKSALKGGALGALRAAPAAYYAGREGDLPGAMQMIDAQNQQRRSSMMASELSKLGDLTPDTFDQAQQIISKYGSQEQLMNFVNMVQSREVDQFRMAQTERDEGRADRDFAADQMWRGRDFAADQMWKEREFGQEERALAAEGRMAGMAEHKDIASAQRLWRPMLDDYRESESAYRTVESSLDTAMGDLALINAFAKVIDPGSVVRTEEGERIRNGAGLPMWLMNRYEEVLGGGQLSGIHAQQIRDQAKVYIQRGRAAYSDRLERVRGMYGPADGYNRQPIGEAWDGTPVEEGYDPHTGRPYEDTRAKLTGRNEKPERGRAAVMSGTGSREDPIRID